MDMPVEQTWNTEAFSNVASALTWQARRQPNAAAIHYPARSALGAKRYDSCTYEQLNELSYETRNLHRAISALIEEL